MERMHEVSLSRFCREGSVGTSEKVLLVVAWVTTVPADFSNRQTLMSQ
jgi:hypothetical protein